MTMTLQKKWDQGIIDLPIKSCGRLDAHTYLPEPTTVGRVTSDRVRYVYFEDGTEVIVLGAYCDEVAYAATQYSRQIQQENQEG